MPGVNSQGETREELLTKLREALSEAIEMNRQDARRAAGTYAVQDGHNNYGTFWRTEGLLVGPQANLRVVLIWLEWALDGTFHFVTL